jgi:hypothetical protein
VSLGVLGWTTWNFEKAIEVDAEISVQASRKILEILISMPVSLLG